MPVKEFREYFLRHSKVTTGNKPDQEPSLVKTYLVKGVTKFMTFLRGDVPSEIMFDKLFESITFKLNKEDTANTTIQGLVKKSSDTDAESRTRNPSSDFTLGVVPHQLPEIVLSTDGSDTIIGTPIELGGLKLSIIRRTLTGIFRKNYKIEVNVDKSIIIDGTTKKIQLNGDLTTPGNSQYYGTNAGGTKGWYGSSIVSKEIYLRSNFSKTNNTLATIDAGGSAFTENVEATSYYRIDAVLFINPNTIGGLKVGFAGSATTTEFLVQADYSDNSTMYIELKSRLLSLFNGANSTAEIATVGNGTLRLSGTIKTNTAGTINLQFAQSVTNASSSIVLVGSYFIIKKIS